MPRLSGITVPIGGQEFVVPGLNLRMVRQLTEGGQLADLSAVDGLPNAKQLASILDIIHGSLVRNYPELTREALEDGVELSQVGELLKSVFAASGIGAKADSPNVPSP